MRSPGRACPAPPAHQPLPTCSAGRCCSSHQGEPVAWSEGRPAHVPGPALSASRQQAVAASRQHVGTRMRVHEAGLAQLAHCSTMLHKAAPCKAQACLLNSAPKATIPLAQDKPALRMKLPIPPRLTRLPLRHQLTRLCWMAACRLPPSMNSVTKHSWLSPGASPSRTNAPCVWGDGERAGGKLAPFCCFLLSCLPLLKSRGSGAHTCHTSRHFPLPPQACESPLPAHHKLQDVGVPARPQDADFARKAGIPQVPCHSTAALQHLQGGQEQRHRQGGARLGGIMRQAPLPENT